MATNFVALDGDKLAFPTFIIPAKARENMFSPALVCVSVCLSLTAITKNVDGFAPNFIRGFLGGKGRPGSCFVMIGRGVWK